MQGDITVKHSWKGPEETKPKGQNVRPFFQTKHPGSKPGRISPDHRSGKGSAWKAMTRPMRRYPGWKKRLVRRVQAGDFGSGSRG